MNKKVLLSIFICLLIGLVSAYFLYRSYKNEAMIAAGNLEKKVYFLQVGAYRNYNNVDLFSKILPNYLVIEENDLYVIYVGITRSKKNLDKLISLYNNKGFNTFIKSKSIKNNKFLNILEKYDSLLLETNDYEMIININKQVLKDYKGDCL